jgi:hypothetical protein
MFWLMIGAAVAVAGLVWMLYRLYASRNLQKFNDGRRATSRLVSRGEFVDGNRRLEVALALTDVAFYYENADMQASLDLEWIEEVEYASELATGRSVVDGKVLRLRCHRQVFEFVLQNAVVLAWKNVLPTRRGSAVVLPRMGGGLTPDLA